MIYFFPSALYVYAVEETCFSLQSEKGIGDIEKFTAAAPTPKQSFGGAFENASIFKALGHAHRRPNLFLIVVLLSSDKNESFINLKSLRRLRAYEQSSKNLTCCIDSCTSSLSRHVILTFWSSRKGPPSNNCKSANQIMMADALKSPLPFQLTAMMNMVISSKLFFLTANPHLFAKELLGHMVPQTKQLRC